MLGIRPPLIIASGPGGYGEYLNLINSKYLGAYTLKTVTYKPRSLTEAPRMAFGSFYLINHIGLENPGVDKFLESLRLGKYDGIFKRTKVILSLGGDDLKEYLKITEKVKPHVDRFVAVEYNFSCPNVTKGGFLLTAKADDWAKLLGRIRELLPRTFLLAKLGIEGILIERAAGYINEAGWEGVTLVNTVRGLHMNPDGGILLGGLSGPILKPISLRAVYEVRKRYQNLYIVAAGGVYSASDAREFIAVGANAISVGSALFKDPNVIEEIGKELGGVVK
ncbi:MAG: dihydroorotate dehydrogenase [Thermotogae bacterium]|nr:dihydroorotate dehydrogenase [Thermotogota bacterium]